MALTVTKTKAVLAAEKAKLAPPAKVIQHGVILDLEEQEELDRLIELTADLAEFDAQIKEQAKLKTKFAAKASGLFNPEDPAIFVGTNGFVEYSAAANSTEITDNNGLIGKLKDTVGYEALLGIIKITLTDAKKYLSETELGKFTSPKVGSRTFKGVTITKPL